LRDILPLLYFNLTYVDTIEDTKANADDDDCAEVCCGDSAETLSSSGAQILPVDICGLRGTLIGDS